MSERERDCLVLSISRKVEGLVIETFKSCEKSLVGTNILYKRTFIDALSGIEGRLKGDICKISNDRTIKYEDDLLIGMSL
jgi:hypothetical protein